MPFGYQKVGLFVCSQKWNIDKWNSLDDSIVAYDSINGFKGKIDRFLNGIG